MFKCIFLNENVWIPIEISLKFVPKGSINNNPALFQIMAWRRPGDKPLPEPIIVSLPTHICVSQPQWVKACFHHVCDRAHIKGTSYLFGHTQIWNAIPACIEHVNTIFRIIFVIARNQLGWYNRQNLHYDKIWNKRWNKSNVCFQLVSCPEYKCHQPKR